VIVVPVQFYPVQKAMVECHASQCGFCTPGFVMSLYSLWMENPNPSKRDVEISVQGNLCRCTGYEPIINAALSVNKYGNPTFDQLNTERENIINKLSRLQDDARVEIGDDNNKAILPANIDDLAQILQDRPNSDLKKIEVNDDMLTFGAGVTYTEIQDYLSKFFPFLENYWDRIAGWQVRNMGTIGGNIANGSPIGDTPPILIALNSDIILRKGNQIRILPIEQLNSAYKISKRREDDISTLAVGISMNIANGLIKDCRIAFGGMAATPKRALITEGSLKGKTWCYEAINEASKMLNEDFSPLSDWRATKEYRMTVARNLLHRFFLEHDLEIIEPIQLHARF